MPNIRTPRIGAQLRVPARGFPLFYGKVRRERALVRDVWEYLRYVSRGKLKGKYRDRADAFIDQAFDFHHAATNPRLSSRPLLYYYCFLNLGKVALLCDGAKFPARLAHGIFDPKANSTTRSLTAQKIGWEGSAADHSRLFPELLKVFSPDRRTPRAAGELRFLDVLREVPGVHRTFCTAAEERPVFVPIEKLELRKDGHQVWVQIQAKKPQTKLAATCKALYGSARFRAFFKDKVRAGDRSDGFDSVSLPYKRRGLDTAIARLAEALRQAGVWGILTRDGYSLYLGEFSDPLPQWCSSYAAIFFLGSLTRYKPYDFDRVTEEYAWVISEFIDTQPLQMLYLLASHISEAEVVVPFAVGA